MPPSFRSVTVALVLSSAAASAAPDDGFVAACGLSGKTSAASCQCQARLARTTFSKAEMKVFVTGMRDGHDAFRSALAAMSEARQKAFIGKVKRLSGHVAIACR